MSDYGQHNPSETSDPPATALLFSLEKVERAITLNGALKPNAVFYSVKITLRNAIMRLLSEEEEGVSRATVS